MQSTREQLRRYRSPLAISGWQRGWGSSSTSSLATEGGRLLLELVSPSNRSCQPTDQSSFGYSHVFKCSKRCGVGNGAISLITSHHQHSACLSANSDANFTISSRRGI